jgi:hypothetical protein
MAWFAVLVTFLFPQILWAQPIEELKTGVVKITAHIEGRQNNTGTGFIVRLEKDAAYIVTAAHVIEGDPHPRVSFYTNQGKEFAGKVLKTEGGDPKGLAILMVEGKLPIGLHILLVNHTFETTAGIPVTVIGFPAKTGTPWTVSTGSLSGIRGRDLAFAALVDEGNSGGPVLVKGKVVGVVTEVKGDFGLAVPSPTIKLTLKGWGVELGRQAHRVLVSGQYSNDGWAIYLRIDDKVEEIFYKLPNDAAYKSTGFHDEINNPETGQPRPNEYIPTPELHERSIILVKYRNVYGEEEGPYELLFDPMLEALKEVKQTLSSSPGSWLAYGLYDGRLLVYFTHLLTRKSMIKEIRYSVDDESLGRNLRFAPDNNVVPFSYNDNEDENPITVPLETKFVAIKIIFKDGTETETRIFHKPQRDLSGRPIPP